MGERAYIDPREAEKLRSSGHTPEEKKERHDRGEKLVREEHEHIENLPEQE